MVMNKQQCGAATMLSKKIQFVFALVAITLVGSLATPSYANEDAIKYRKGVMKAVGGTMGSLAAILKGKAPMSHAPALTTAMVQLSNVAADVFPEGSGGEMTGAKDNIWTEKDKFQASVKAFQTAAMGISKASGDKAAFGKAFKALGGSCGGCHKPFRKPKK
jgi:cytochrome c556